MQTTDLTHRKSPLSLRDFDQNEFHFFDKAKGEFYETGQKQIDCPKCKAKGRQGYIVVLRHSDGRFIDHRFTDGGDFFCMPCHNEKIDGLRK